MFTWDFSSVLRQSYIAVNIPHRTTFAWSHRLWYILFLFSFVPIGIFWFICWFLQWATGFSVAFCLIYIFFFSLLLVIDVWFHTIVVKKDACYDSIFFGIYWDLFCGLTCDLCTGGRKLHVRLWRMCIVLLLGGILFIYLLSSYWIMFHLRPLICSSM